MPPPANRVAGGNSPTPFATESPLLRPRRPRIPAVGPTLRLTERVATDFVKEAAEWTVLYAKEVSDPG